jgi:putative SbcD/Mre11-related phosphoesterase
MLKIVPGEPAALIEGREKALVVADLHLGFERELSQLGINMPSQTEKLYMRLRNLIAKHGPSRVILLGDVKHGVPAITEQEWTDIPVFFERLLELGVEVDVVPGNHDGNLEPLTPRQVKIHKGRGVVVEGVALIHGNAWPSKELLTCGVLLMGHNHPTVEFRDRLGFRETASAWLSLEVTPRSRSLLAKEYGLEDERNVKLKKVVVMPSFNTLLSGKPINSEDRRLLGPLLEAIFKAEAAEVFLLDGTFLGRVSELPQALLTASELSM